MNFYTFFALKTQLRIYEDLKNKNKNAFSTLILWPTQIQLSDIENKKKP
jgi:hypothetical protein